MKWRFASAALTYGMVLMVSQAVAAPTAVSLVPDRVSVNGSLVDWGQLGPAGTVVSQPFQATTNSGYSFTVLKNNSELSYVRVDQGAGFVGDFLPDDRLLFATSLTAFDLRFTTPIRGLGTQLQHEHGAVWFPYARIFTIDGGDYEFQFPADTNDFSADGSAPFVGFLAERPVITRVLLDSVFGGNTAINALSVNVPEPAIAGALLAACFVSRRRRWLAGSAARRTTLPIPQN